MNKTLFSVIQSLSNTLNIEPSKINTVARLREDLGLDSMSSLMFLMDLEDSIPGFTVNPETLDTSYLESVNSICHYVDSQLAKAAMI